VLNEGNVGEATFGVVNCAEWLRKGFRGGLKKTHARILWNLWYWRHWLPRTLPSGMWRSLLSWKLMKIHWHWKQHVFP